MSTLEEYRDREADKQLWGECQPGNHCFDCGCPDLEQGYKVGFDSALSLNLPVKFADWGNNMTMKEREDMVLHFGYFTIKTEEAYQYWLEFIYKSE